MALYSIMLNADWCVVRTILKSWIQVIRNALKMKTRFVD